jgi:hypothetical protein
MGSGGEAERGRLGGRLSNSYVDLLEIPSVIHDVQPAKLNKDLQIATISQQ